MATPKSELQQTVSDLLNALSHASAKLDSTNKVLAQIQQNLEHETPDRKITLGLAYAAELVCLQVENDLDELIFDFDHKLTASIGKLSASEGKKHG